MTLFHSFLCKITHFPGSFHWKMALETKTCSNLLIIEAHLFTQAREGCCDHSWAMLKETDSQLSWGRTLWWESLPVPAEAEADGWGRGLQWWPCPFCATQQWCLASVMSQVFCVNFPGVGPLVLLLQAVFSQPILPESTLWTPLSSTQCPLHQETHNSYWSAQGWGTDHACVSYFVLPSAESTISFDPPKFPFCSSWSPHIFWMWEPVLTFSLPPGLLAPFLFPFLFFFLSSYPVVRGFFLSF